jgi:gamma-glutamylputrescine oxidase
MFSYWEQQSFSHYDHIVIGAGLVGLSAAIALKQAKSGRVLVLERGLLPTGASTRNAGFACMGSATELLDDLQHSTEEEVISLFAARKRGLELLRATLGDAAIGYRVRGSYELLSSKELYAIEQLDRLNDMLLPVTGKKTFRPANDRIKDTGFGGEYIAGLVENTCEGELNSGMMMRSLMDKATGCGVEKLTGADVRAFDETEQEVTVTINDPFRKGAWAVKCRSLTICTNAFTGQLLPEEDVIPGRGQVLVTDVIPGLPFKGIYHFDKGFYYFREIDGRILFGGGRNLDIAGEATTDMNVTDLIQNDLEEKLRTIIMPGTRCGIACRWAGTMAFGQTKRPIIKAFSDRVYGAFRMGGMGVALGSEAARQVAEMNKI